MSSQAHKRTSVSDTQKAIGNVKSIKCIFGLSQYVHHIIFDLVRKIRLTGIPTRINLSEYLTKTHDMAWEIYFQLLKLPNTTNTVFSSTHALINISKEYSPLKQDVSGLAKIILNQYAYFERDGVFDVRAERAFWSKASFPTRRAIHYTLNPESKTKRTSSFFDFLRVNQSFMRLHCKTAETFGYSNIKEEFERTVVESGIPHVKNETNLFVLYDPNVYRYFSALSFADTAISTSKMLRNSYVWSICFIIYNLLKSKSLDHVDSNLNNTYISAELVDTAKFKFEPTVLKKPIFDSKKPEIKNDDEIVYLIDKDLSLIFRRCDIASLEVFHKYVSMHYKYRSQDKLTSIILNIGRGVYNFDAKNFNTETLETFVWDYVMSQYKKLFNMSLTKILI